jgi:hypothetical protein
MTTATDNARLLDAFWSEVALRGWSKVTLAGVAAAAGLGLADLRGHGGLLGLLKLHGEEVDRSVLAGTVPGQGGSPRERVFDMLMRRFDAMQPHRAGIVRLTGDLKGDPLTALAIAPLLTRSIGWMLEGAGIDTSGALGALRVKGTVAVWLAAAKVWREDENPDLGSTMAALDKALDRAEQIARTLRLPDGDLQAMPEAAPAAPLDDPPPPPGDMPAADVPPPA